MGKTQITDRSASAWAKKIHLRHLALNRTNLRDQAVLALPSTLTYLDLTDTNITLGCENYVRHVFGVRRAELIINS